MTNKGNDMPMNGETTPQPQYAGFLARGMAMGIDILLIHLLYFACLCATAAVLWVHSPHWLVLIPSLLFCLLLFLLTFPLFIAVYFLALHGWQGQTLGKMFMGLRVIRSDGGEVTPGIAFLRFIGFALSILPVGLGLFWSIIDREKCGWHDHVADTRVVLKVSS
ncbi:RDD family protein [Thiovibrio frasassiensis]|uniref:RDD family protein n=1 Tax=Thiovibrio frasassiensis TaxID=2984131 RepID=A0A9X4RLE8_9BACT|nr:RDD family protein [Thiovibrio frasassiensis]MDG4475629.1 RDD family protein [Thiovibrio frasassiensis]